MLNCRSRTIVTSGAFLLVFATGVCAQNIGQQSRQPDRASSDAISPQTEKELPAIQASLSPWQQPVAPVSLQLSPAQNGANENKNANQNESGQDSGPKNDRIFLVIPNYTTVEVPVKFMPLTVKEKFKLGAEDAFDPYAFPLAAALAGIAQAENEDATWGQGWKGYGKRYAAGFGDATIGSFMTTGVFPSIFREDPRYFRNGKGGFWHRSGIATKRLFVTRTDSDHSQFNFSEFGGNAAAAAISLTYHSREERTFSTFGSNWGTQIAIDFISNQLKEFWPDIRRKIFKEKKQPAPVQ